MGRRHVWLLGIALAAANGCGHARTVEPAVPPAEAKKAEKKDEKKEETKAEEKKTEAVDGKAEEAPKKTAATFTSHHKGDAKRSEGAVRLSTSPTALLKPGALESIQEKLAHEGTLKGEPTGKMDAATQKALAEFQRDHDLPATGVADDATVKRLGLKPADVFRSGPTD